MLQDSESATDEELAAFYDPGHGLARENNGEQLPVDFHQVHANWDGEIPLKFARH